MALVLSGYATPRADYDAEFGTGVASQWDDQSGNGWHCTQPTVGNQPAITTNVWGSLPAYRFTYAAAKHWLIPAAVFSGLTECEVFIALTVDADPPASGGAALKTGSHGGAQIDAHPWTDGYLYSDFCSTVRKDTMGYLANGSRRSLTGTRAHILNFRSKASDWACTLNGQTLRHTTTNTFGVGATLTIGSGGTTAGQYALLGYIGRVFFVGSVVSESTRYSIVTAMMNYYGSGFPRADTYKYPANQSSPDSRVWVPSDSRLFTQRSATDNELIRSSSPDRPSLVRGGQVSSALFPKSGDALLNFKTERWAYSSNSRSTGTGGALSVPSTSTVTWYRMHGWDTLSSTWITWDVSITPDPTGARHPTPGAISVSGAFIINRWQA